jgi:hypothetical protein
MAKKESLQPQKSVIPEDVDGNIAAAIADTSQGRSVRPERVREHRRTGSWRARVAAVLPHAASRVHLATAFCDDGAQWLLVSRQRLVSVAFESNRDQ